MTHRPAGVEPPHPYSHCSRQGLPSRALGLGPEAGWVLPSTDRARQTKQAQWGGAGDLGVF